MFHTLFLTITFAACFFVLGKQPHVIIDIVLLTLYQGLSFILPIVIAIAGLNTTRIVIKRKLIYCFGYEKYIKMLFFPSTIIHEGSHAIMCLIFGLKITDICIRHQGGYVTYMYNSKNLFHIIGIFFVGIAPFLVGCSLFYSLAIFLRHAGVSLSPVPVAMVMPPDLLDVTGIFLNIGLATIQNIGNICSFSNFTHPLFYVYIFISFFAGTFMSPSVSDIKISIQGFIVIMLYFCMINTVLFILGINIFAYTAKVISLSSQAISIVVFIIILNEILVVALTIHGLLKN